MKEDQIIRGTDGDGNPEFVEEEKLNTPIRRCLFLRGESECQWYPIDLPEGTIADNAEHNVGTTKVVDAITGETLWRNKK